MSNHPHITQLIQTDEFSFDTYDNHIKRRLSDMQGMFYDQAAYQELLETGDLLLYEVLELLRPEEPGELLSGLSILHPGVVGDEYYMTKGHFHTVLETAEIYYCLNGEGMMVMETPEGDWSVEKLIPGSVLYVPPRWAHRSVNTSPTEDLITFFVYPGNAGHDYGSIKYQGFKKLVIKGDQGPEIIDNARWLPPEDRNK
jgi:glucose-6-phosphate isomerase